MKITAKNYVKTVQQGVVLEYKGKYWGIVYEDGQCTSYGWADIEKVEMLAPGSTLSDFTRYDVVNGASLKKVTKTIRWQF